jgi:hypothetical protein
LKNEWKYTAGEQEKHSGRFRRLEDSDFDLKEFEGDIISHATKYILTQSYI